MTCHHGTPTGTIPCDGCLQEIRAAANWQAQQQQRGLQGQSIAAEARLGGVTRAVHGQAALLDQLGLRDSGSTLDVMMDAISLRTDLVSDHVVAIVGDVNAPGHAFGVRMSGEMLAAHGLRRRSPTAAYDPERLRLADECGRLADENRVLLQENATLRRRLERTRR